jgi:hypothetical protein
MALMLPAVILVIIVLILVVTRMNELFMISVRQGRTLVVRGRIPPALLRDLEDVISRAGIVQATIRAVKDENHARLVVTGTDEFTAQRLRNTFGIHPVSKLRKASAPDADRNLGQWLGWTWLAWLLFSRRR